MVSRGRIGSAIRLPRRRNDGPALRGRFGEKAAMILFVDVDNAPPGSGRPLEILERLGNLVVLSGMKLEA